VSKSRRHLLRFYPPAWRARYGRELLTVIEAGSGRDRLSVRVSLDVVRAGLSQRLRSCGLMGDDLPAESGAKAGLLLVLCSWSVFVIAGVGLQKTAEHWQAVVPTHEEALPAAAFGTVVVAAALGSAAVLLGIVFTTGPLISFLRSGGWRQIRRSVIIAICLSGLTVVVVVAIASWAQQLTSAQRNGSDLLYSLVFLVLVAASVGSIIAWTDTAIRIGRELTLKRATLRLETGFAGAVTLTMCTMTVATTLWWAAVANAAPSFLGGGIPWKMIVLTTLMLAAATTATAGTLRSAHTTRQLTRT